MLRVFKNSRHTKIFHDIAASELDGQKSKISISESFQRYIEEILPRATKTKSKRQLSATCTTTWKTPS